MVKTEAIVDTCFLQKISSEGNNPENIKKIIDELEFIPVAHPYIVDHEFALCSYLEILIKEGYIRKIEYDEFIKDEFDKQLYEGYFMQIHEDLRKHLEAKGGKKQICQLQMKRSQTIFTTHLNASSMGDVHMILMAAFMQLPIILTEDSDIELLRIFAQKRISLGTCKLEIYNAWELIKQIAMKQDSSLSKKELEVILKQMGEKSHRSEMKQIWNENHA